MNHLWYSIFRTIIITVIAGFSLSLGKAVSAQTPRLIHPATYHAGIPFPVVVEVELNSFVSTIHNNTEDIHWSDDQNNGTVGLELKHGRTSTLLDQSLIGDLDLDWMGEMTTVPVETGAIVDHSGTIGSNETWQTGFVHHVTSDLTISSGVLLTIEAGCWVVFDGLFNITVDGTMNISGTESHPVVLAGNGPGEWGGIIINMNGELTSTHVFMIHGGADSSLAFGHSNSQAVVKTENGNAELTRTYLMDNAGKGIGASGGSIEFVDGLIQRCDMGGEFQNAYADIRLSHILDTPNDDLVQVDDDNDALYFSGTSSVVSGPSRVDSCVFHTGKDDGIDHNGAFVMVLGSIISDFDNEGVAASNTNSISLYNTLIKNCEQGIEAGYGSPQVFVDHCVMYNNDIGLRFGDWYDWGCSGHITCTNSITAGNTDNIDNFDVLTNGPVANAIDITYTLTNDSDHDGGTGNLAGSPMFSQSFHLEAGSVGVGASDDGSDMGLVGSTITSIEEELTEELSLRDGRFEVWDLLGSKVMEKASWLNLQSLGTGMYLIRSTEFPNRTIKIAVAE